MVSTEHSEAGPASAATTRPRPAAYYPLLVAAVTLAGFLLRAHRLAAQSLWSDEDITLDRAAQPLGELLSSLPVEHAPLYFALMRLWTRLAGASDLALRYPSLAFGVLAIPLVAFMAARFSGRRTALVAAAVVAVNPFMVWYGQEARMYTLVAALGLLSLAAVYRAEGTRRAAWWVAAGIAAALCVYTHYYGALVVLVLGSWALLDIARDGRGAWRGWLIAAAAGAIAFTPWLGRAARVAQFPGWREDQDLSQLVRGAVASWAAGTGFAAPPVSWTTWLYVLLAVGGLAVLLFRAVNGPGRKTSLRLLLFAVVPGLVVAALLLRNPDFHPRYYFAALPALYLVVAVGASAGPRPLTALLTFLLVLGAAAPLHRLYSDPAAQKQDYRAVIRLVEAAGFEAAAAEGTMAADADDEGVVMLLLDGPPFGMMERYRSKDSPVKIVNLHSSALSRLGAAELDAEIERRAARYEQVWLAEDGASKGEGAAWLNANAFPVSQQSIQDIALTRYAYFGSSTEPAERDSGAEGTSGDDHADGAAPDGPASPTAKSADTAIGTSATAGTESGTEAGTVTGLTIALDGPVRLEVHLPSAVTAGGVLPVELVWSVDQAALEFLANREHKVAVRLEGPAGATSREVAHADRRPVNWTRPTTTWRLGEAIVDRHGLLVRHDSPPGDYTLTVVLYDERDPSKKWEGNTGPVIEVLAPSEGRTERP